MRIRGPLDSGSNLVRDYVDRVRSLQFAGRFASRRGALSDFGTWRSYRRRDGGLPHRLATVATMRDGTCRMRSLCEQDDRGRLLLGTLAIGAVALAGLEPR